MQKPQRNPLVFAGGCSFNVSQGQLIVPVYAAGIAKLGAAVKDAGCKQSVWWWVRVVFPPPRHRKGEHRSEERLHGMTAGLAHLLAIKNCCCWFDHIKGLKDFY